MPYHPLQTLTKPIEEFDIFLKFGQTHLCPTGFTNPDFQGFAHQKEGIIDPPRLFMPSFENRESLRLLAGS